MFFVVSNTSLLLFLFQISEIILQSGLKNRVESGLDEALNVGFFLREESIERVLAHHLLGHGPRDFFRDRRDREIRVVILIDLRGISNEIVWNKRV